MTKDSTVKPAHLPSKSKSRKPIKKQNAISLIDEKIGWNGTMFPFRGTSELQECESKETTGSDYDDEEWTTPTTSTTVKLNNALSALMGAYMSGSESEEETPNEVSISKSIVEIPVKKVDDTECSKCITIEDTEAPVELRIVKEPDHPTAVVERVEQNAPEIETKEVHEHKRKRRKLSRRKVNNKASRANIQGSQRPASGSTNLDNFPYKFKKRKVTLLEKLLENEIIRERNTILQCVRYVIENNFFDN